MVVVLLKGPVKGVRMAILHFLQSLQLFPGKSAGLRNGWENVGLVAVESSML